MLDAKLWGPAGAFQCGKTGREQSRWKAKESGKKVQTGEVVGPWEDPDCR